MAMTPLLFNTLLTLYIFFPHHLYISCCFSTFYLIFSPSAPDILSAFLSAAIDFLYRNRICLSCKALLMTTEQEKRARALGALFTKPIFYIIAEKFPILPQSLLRTTALLP